MSPEFSNAYWNRADICSQVTESELQSMQHMAEDTRFLDEDRVHWYYALAHAYEKRNEYEHSFKFMQLGAALKRRTIGYDHAKEMEELDRIPKTFTDGLLSKPTSLNNSNRPIFICGLPRTGTTLIEQIIASHPDVIAGGELLELPRAADFVLQEKALPISYPDWATLLTPDDWRAIGERYLERTEALQSERRFTDKMPLNFKALGVVHMSLPEAKIVHCVRHPLDTLLGCYKQLFSVGIRFSYNLDELADTYLKYRDVMNHWQSCFSEKILTIHYEDMVFDQETQTRRLLTFLDLEWADSCLNFHASKRPVRTASNSQVRKPLFKSSIGIWKNYRTELAGLRERLEPYTGPLR